ncbi:hypothetical protein SKAU_G00284840 [Synaphobranchus kaupii]|uniref:Uncharacterized protein n=1 Tax=Synaphobranchus kaupii TaxID=118154 RepID=A0A9Q1EY11_SYNKA|nr:hypothetical protein SKAU_G00284840 [Synaphobranchus kaupii]
MQACIRDVNRQMKELQITMESARRPNGKNHSSNTRAALTGPLSTLQESQYQSRFHIQHKQSGQIKPSHLGHSPVWIQLHLPSMYKLLCLSHSLFQTQLSLPNVHQLLPLRHSPVTSQLHQNCKEFLSPCLSHCYSNLLHGRPQHIQCLPMVSILCLSCCLISLMCSILSMDSHQLPSTCPCTLWPPVDPIVPNIMEMAIVSSFGIPKPKLTSFSTGKE